MAAAWDHRDAAGQPGDSEDAGSRLVDVDEEPEGATVDPADDKRGGDELVAVRARCDGVPKLYAVAHPHAEIAGSAAGDQYAGAIGRKRSLGGGGVPEAA